MKAKRKGSNEAVSEVIGTVSLLGIAIALFAILHIIVFSYPVSPSTPSVSLIGTIDYIDDSDGRIILDHLGGDPLGLDTTKVLLTIGGNEEEPKLARDYLYSNTSNEDDLWNIGEKLVINPDTNITGLRVEATVVDVESNSIVMMGKIQEGKN